MNLLQPFQFYSGEKIFFVLHIAVVPNVTRTVGLWTPTRERMGTRTHCVASRMQSVFGAGKVMSAGVLEGLIGPFDAEDIPVRKHLTGTVSSHPVQGCVDQGIGCFKGPSTACIAKMLLQSLS